MKLKINHVCVYILLILIGFMFIFSSRETDAKIVTQNGNINKMGNIALKIEDVKLGKNFEREYIIDKTGLNAHSKIKSENITDNSSIYRISGQAGKKIPAIAFSNSETNSGQYKIYVYTGNTKMKRINYTKEIDSNKFDKRNLEETEINISLNDILEYEIPEINGVHVEKSNIYFIISYNNTKGNKSLCIFKINSNDMSIDKISGREVVADKKYESVLFSEVDGTDERGYLCYIMEKKINSDEVQPLSEIYICKYDINKNKSFDCKILQNATEIRFSYQEDKLHILEGAIYTDIKDTVNDFRIIDIDLNSMEFTESQIDCMERKPDTLLSFYIENDRIYVFSYSATANKSNLSKLEVIDRKNQSILFDAKIFNLQNSNDSSFEKVGR
ncbi:hypothetical protein EXD82_04905 [Peptacetobacter hominis]|uniref:Uncharacterized protein n=1 Tax=Peptacetobacter hominis TaxID=2743610 RepID=A0A544QVM8_9FIRM|nr:hypothetical protein [Peptacetobacter hominis]TQQ84744.1 hypothetical protein EXD82_04905 [Peptacetobacter hominis]